MIEATAFVAGALAFLWFLGGFIVFEETKDKTARVLYWLGSAALVLIFVLALIGAIGEDHRETRNLDRKLREACDGKRVIERVKNESDVRIFFRCENDNTWRVYHNG